MISYGHHLYPGRLFVVEGTDGSGKLTQLALLAGRQRVRDSEVAVWLLHHFVSERTKHYCYALARWHKWKTEGFLDGVREVVKGDLMAEVKHPQKRAAS